MYLRFLRSLSVMICVFVLGHTNAVGQQTYKFDSSSVLEYAKNLHEQKMKEPQFQPVCENGNGTCVKDIFNWTNVQMIQAVALAEEYAKIKNNHNIICSPKYRKAGNDDWVQCVDVSGQNFYEFKFDDVKETFDNKIQIDVVTAVCQIHGGKVRDQYTRFCDDANCVAVNKSLERFGYSAKFENILNHQSESGCKLFYNTVNGHNYQLRDGGDKFHIDSRKFLKLQLQSGADLKFFVQRYIERQMTDAGIEMQSVRCNDGFQTFFYSDKIINSKEDMLTCYATDADGNEYALDFLFDDANEMLNFEAKAGTSGLNCLAGKGGVYDGKNCSGLSQEQCRMLNYELPGGTEWNTMLDTCVLKDASKAQSIKENARTIGKYAVGGTIVIITIVSGGTALAIVGGAAATIGAGKASEVQIAKEDRVREFLAKSAQCKSRDCAEQVLTQYINETVAFYDDLDEDSQVWIALDNELARIMELLPANADIFQDAISQAIRESQDIRNWDSWPIEEKRSFAANALILIGAVAGLSEFAFKSWQSIVKLFRTTKSGYSSARILTDKLTSLFRTLKESVDTVAEVAGVADDSMDTIDVTSKIGVAMQAMM